MEVQLDLDRLFDLAHVILGQDAGPPEKPFLADRRQLVRHGLAFSLRNKLFSASRTSFYMPYT